MNALKVMLNKPQYLFRPTQLLRRLRQQGKPTAQFETAVLPWGLEIRIRPHEMLGSSIRRMGVFDLVVTEMLYRLLDAGETAIDAGANIGYMTSILAVKAGAHGRVVSFEPHPEVFRELAYNVEQWSKVDTVAQISIHETALSCEAGQARLDAGDLFDKNRGTASLAGTVFSSGDSGTHYDVAMSRLDTFFDADQQIGVLKIDVEGHEMEVLQGASDLLNKHRVRDIVFEEHRPLPTPVTQHLEVLGYKIFDFSQSLFGVILTPAMERPVSHLWDAANYLATLDPDRAVSRLRKRGWQVLTGGTGASRRSNRGEL